MPAERTADTRSVGHFPRGTDGSNPVPSSSESSANPLFSKSVAQFTRKAAPSFSTLQMRPIPRDEIGTVCKRGRKGRCLAPRPVSVGPAAITLDPFEKAFEIRPQLGGNIPGCEGSTRPRLHYFLLLARGLAREQSPLTWRSLSGSAGIRLPCLRMCPRMARPQGCVDHAVCLQPQTARQPLRCFFLCFVVQEDLRLPDSALRLVLRGVAASHHSLEPRRPVASLNPAADCGTARRSRLAGRRP
jgi:hypothetical protein